MVRVGLNTLPLFGKSEGVRRYIRELQSAAPAAGIAFAELPLQGTRRRKALQLPKVGFAARHVLELTALPGIRNQDLLHYTDTYGPLHSRKPYVITVHDTTFLTHPHLHDATVVRWLTTLCRRTWPGAAAFIAVTETTRQDMIALGVDPHRITVVHHGVDHMARLRVQHEALPAGLQPRRYFFFMGNLEPRKNLPLLLEAFERAAESLPSDIKLVLAGKFAWGAQPLHAMDRLTAAGRMLHLGFVPDETAALLIRDSLAFVYPSTYEGFGLPPLEALALGAHVIVGDNPAAREVLGGSVQFVDTGDPRALSAALHDAMTRPLSPKAGTEHAAAFTWLRAAEQTAAVYRTVAEPSA